MSQHVVRLESEGSGYRFIGTKEQVEIEEGDQFITLTNVQLERYLGRELQWSDGKPVGLSSEEVDHLGVLMECHHTLYANDKISDEAKKRITEHLKNCDCGDDPRFTLKVLIDNEVVARTSEKIADKLRELKPQEQRKVIKQLRKDNRERKRQDERELRQVRKEKAILEKMSTAGTEIEQWIKQPLVLQTPPATMFHHLRQSVIDREAIYWQAFRRRIEQGRALRDINPNEFEEMWADASVFLIEHNWAGAFAGAKDYLGGEIKLPDEVCAFEFRISGRHVIAVVCDSDDRTFMQPVLRVEDGWVIGEYVYYLDLEGKWQTEQKHGGGNDMLRGLVDLMGEQIKAVAVALDAEVASTEVIRAPHKMNHARERRGKLPVSSYHVVSLARRSRAPRLEREPGTEPAYHVRLHFRRGHWRHYEDHKTWIKWMLVGDPDLGFVDKHYKL